MATPNYKPLLNSSENLKALLAEQNSQGITSAVFSGNEPIDVLSAKTIFNAAKSAEDIAGVSSITAGTGISVSGATGNVTITSTVTGTLPTQTGNSGKLLTTDGTNSSWTTTPVATSLTGPAATALTLSGGDSGASLVLGSGASGRVSAFNSVGIYDVTGQILEVSTGANQSNLVLGRTSTTSGDTLGAISFGTSGASNTKRGVILAATLRATATTNASASLDIYTNNAGAIAERARFTETGNLLIGTTTDMASTAGGLTVAATGSGATATGVNTGGLRSANFGLSTVSGGPSYFGGGIYSAGVTTAAAGAIGVTSTDPSLRLKATGAVVADQNTYEIRNVGATSNTYLQFRTVNDANSVFTTRMALWNSGGLYLGNSGAFADPGSTNLWIEGAFRGTQLTSPSGSALTLGTTSFGTAMTIASATGVVTLPGTTPSTGVGTGALQVAGGIYAGAASVFGSTVATTGGIVVNGTITPASGSGLEIYGGASNGLRAYNRTGAVYLPLRFDGSDILIQSSGTGFVVNNNSGNPSLTINGGTGVASFGYAATFAGAVTATLGTNYPPQTAPASPASGWVLYTDSGDGNKLKAKASTGTVVTIGTP